jgi:hypothetical protein
MSEPARDLIQARQGEEIARHGERLGSVERQLSEVLTNFAAIRGTLMDQAAVLGPLRDVNERLEGLQRRFDRLFPPEESDGAEFYSPAPVPRWWEEMSEADRERHLERIRNWVDTVYRPMFGIIAARLPADWERRPFCLTVLDVMAELHKVLYLQPVRTQGMLSGQAELLSRLIPALADLMTNEARDDLARQRWDRRAANEAG